MSYEMVKYLIILRLNITFIYYLVFKITINSYYITIFYTFSFRRRSSYMSLERRSSWRDFFFRSRATASSVRMPPDSRVI